MMGKPNEWDYWCPSEGKHLIDPNELHVGVCSPDGTVLQLVAVVPPIALRDAKSQANVIAEVVTDELAQRDWSDRDSWASWLHAHGHPMSATDWPPKFDPMTGKPKHRTKENTP